MLQPFLFRYEVSVGDAGNLISSRTSAFQVNLLAQKPKLPRVGEVSWPLENFGHLKMAWRRLQHQLVSLSFTEVDTKWPEHILVANDSATKMDRTTTTTICAIKTRHE